MTQINKGEPLTIETLLELWDNYCTWSWEESTKNGAPVPDANYVSFINFIQWLEKSNG